MDVRTLIQNLLDFDMDTEIDFVVDQDEISDFELDLAGIHTKYVQFKIDTTGKTLMDDRDLSVMEDQIEKIDGLENRITELEEANDLLQTEIDELK